MIDQKGRPKGAALSHLYGLWTVLTGLNQRHSNKHPTDGIHCCCGLKNPYTQWSGLQIQTNGSHSVATPVPCMGLIRFSLFDAVRISVIY
jgi:hypothetical protein